MFDFSALINLASFAGGILLGITLIGAAFLSYKANANLQRAILMFLAGIIFLLIAIRDFSPPFLPALLP
ncbi:hypothetical protein [Azotosporobacter soli]|uniref:hypothetical protein n=1 Tax=Azotosporobacter soli TaxID=3055040 RepID=UPI0031FEC579